MGIDEYRVQGIEHIFAAAVIVVAGNGERVDNSDV